jgi:hypothetical protein
MMRRRTDKKLIPTERLAFARDAGSEPMEHPA